MSNEIYGYSGFEALEEVLEKYIEKVDNSIDVLEKGAKEFVNDLLKLPQPMSRIRKASYTHLVRSFAYRKKNKEIEVGWGKYYGPMVEHGAKQMKSEHPHVNPLWEKNKEKYYKLMLTELGMKTW